MPEPKYPHFVLATIWEHIEPLDRGERYEDPLLDALEGVGDVAGGGSNFSPQAGIQSVNIDIEVADIEAALPLIKSTLEARGAPKGSQLSYDQDGLERVEEFGVTECVAVYLDGIGLPDDVYKNSDINDLADQLDEAMGAAGEIRASWAGPKETSIYMFGADAEALYSKIQPVLKSYPLCQNARVVIRHGKPSLHPREIRLPPHE